MSETPRTDSLDNLIWANYYRDDPTQDSKGYLEMTDYARLLERELAWAKKLIQEQADAITRHAGPNESLKHLRHVIGFIRRDNGEVRDERCNECIAAHEYVKRLDATDDGSKS